MSEDIRDEELYEPAAEEQQERKNLVEKIADAYERRQNDARGSYKKRRKKKDNRDNFLKMYTRTCDRVFGYAYQYTLNHEDALLITCDAYVDMYAHIADLRRSISVDSWQRDCIDRAVRKLLRAQRLNLLHEKEPGSDPDPLSEDEREMIWSRVNKLGKIDAWRLMPVPGQSSAFSVMRDQYISDLGSMTIMDIGKTALIALGALAAVVGVIYLAVKLISSTTTLQIEPMREIYLDERSYAVTTAMTEVSIDDKVVSQHIASAEKIASYESWQLVLSSRANASSTVSYETYTVTSTELTYKEELMSSHTPIFTPAEETGLSVVSGALTNDIEIDMPIHMMLEEIDTDCETDAELLENIYEYVGRNIKYSDGDSSSKTESDLLKWYFKHGSGDSRHYAALLAAVYRAAGYSCDIIEGCFIVNAGTSYETYVRHYWNCVHVNGIDYYMDLEADCDANGTMVRRNYFMATRGNARWDIYSRDHYIDAKSE